uniref:Uncharacterized protein n=1 Tax=Chromera velia CCMP2878 TaxID=1169474 RepID=A0A0G4HNV5_9ALVE|eukprot:Cvel_29623.t1-p1 / transcript=Cvel_29623.t1 / gene=Cvel_29623 / organism=Chromera_velia_CCMP2878 / gene_product=hypothetical protein / transcript_product=hypothetical protein / location=Cvel_scaffold4085:4905-11495(+) / protein_length=908 / sequence_SO=supercontig / SO=protein_coding / is_pseudo=false
MQKGVWRKGRLLRYRPAAGEVEGGGEWEYEGGLKRGVPDGEGMKLWKDGKVERGHWALGVLLKGRIEAEGDIREGTFLDGQLHGKGSHEWIDKTTGLHMKYVGEFFRGDREGRGRLERGDGRVDEGTWEEGKCIRSLAFCLARFAHLRDMTQEHPADLPEGTICLQCRASTNSGSVDQEGVEGGLLSESTAWGGDSAAVSVGASRDFSGKKIKGNVEGQKGSRGGGSSGSAVFAVSSGMETLEGEGEAVSSFRVGGPSSPPVENGVSDDSAADSGGEGEEGKRSKRGLYRQRRKRLSMKKSFWCCRTCTGVTICGDCYFSLLFESPARFYTRSSLGFLSESGAIAFLRGDSFIEWVKGGLMGRMTGFMETDARRGSITVNEVKGLLTNPVFWEKMRMPKRRQEMPSGLFERRTNVILSPKTDVFCVSYPWHGPFTCDVQGFHTARIAAFIEKRHFDFPDRKAVVFWDFCSLYQPVMDVLAGIRKKRSVMEEQLFSFALRNMDTLFGHRETALIRCTGLHDLARNPTPADSRAWCNFELLLQTLKRPSSIKVLPHAAHKWEQQLCRENGNNRAPWGAVLIPMLPPSFATKMRELAVDSDTGRKREGEFALRVRDEEDREMLINRYGSFLRSLSAGMTELCLSDESSFDDESAGELSEFLCWLSVAAENLQAGLDESNGEERGEIGNGGEENENGIQGDHDGGVGGGVSPSGGGDHNDAAQALSAGMGGMNRRGGGRSGAFWSPVLSHLDLSGTSISDSGLKVLLTDGLRRLASVLVSLRFVSFANCEGITDRSFTPLREWIKIWEGFAQADFTLVTEDPENEAKGVEMEKEGQQRKSGHKGKHGTKGKSRKDKKGNALVQQAEIEGNQDEQERERECRQWTLVILGTNLTRPYYLKLAEENPVGGWVGE